MRPPAAGAPPFGADGALSVSSLLWVAGCARSAPGLCVAGRGQRGMRLRGRAVGARTLPRSRSSPAIKDSSTAAATRTWSMGRAIM